MKFATPAIGPSPRVSVSSFSHPTPIPTRDIARFSHLPISLLPSTAGCHLRLPRPCFIPRLPCASHRGNRLCIAKRTLLLLQLALSPDIDARQAPMRMSRWWRSPRSSCSTFLIVFARRYYLNTLHAQKTRLLFGPSQFCVIYRLT